MPKPNPLSQALNRPSTVSATIQVTDKPNQIMSPKPVGHAREGTVLVAGHFSPQVQIALKVIAAEERTTIQALLAEGINTVFAKRGKPEIAKFSSV